MKKTLITAISFYQNFISALIGPCCRFHPTCSEYAVLAIEKHGVLKGGFFAVKRILRCNPWGGSGIDKVPGEK